MSGFLSIVKKSNVLSLVHTEQFKKTMICISVGIISGFLIASFRLKMGLPGHKAFFWMTPLLISRFLTGAKVGTTAGGMFAAMTVYSLGANLAGGSVGFPLIALAAGVLDAVANYIEQNKSSLFSMFFLLAFAGLIANLICLTKRMFLPTGISLHHLFGAEGMMFRAFSYMFFGALSGVVATVTIKASKKIKDDRD